MPITLDAVLAFVREHTSLTDAETQALCDRARSRDYWLSLCEDMTIGEIRPAPAAARAEPPALETAVADYRELGHCAVHDAFPIDEIARLRTAVLRVHDAGWPMIFAFVYDRFWTIAQAPAFDTFARTLLGPGYQPTVSFWVNHVAARRGKSGFPPHLDDVRPGFHATTCWVPLTPATTENGCVYVVERSSESPQAVANLQDETIPTKQVRRDLLLRVRALPASPGSFLAWPNETLHWGGMYSRGDARLALSYHLTGADYENIDPALRLALVPEQPLPSFASRLRWVSTSLLRFRTRDPLLERFAPVAKQLRSASRSAAGAPAADES